MNAVAEQAARYIDLGWVPVPVKPREKRPIHDGWPSMRITTADIERYFYGDMNVGVLLGDGSNGLCDVDLDCMEALALAGRLLPPSASFGRASALRSHWIYQARHTQTEKFQDTDGKMLVELRANKVGNEGEGLQTVFPRSIHPSGEAIEWDPDAAENVTEIKPDVLRTAVARLAAAVLLVRHGWRSDDAIAFVEGPRPYLVADLDKKVYDKLARWLNLPPRTEPTALRVVREGEDKRLKRAAAYLAKCPAAVSGQGGHLNAWKAALSVVRGFELSEGEAYDLLSRDFNPRCDPPWTEKELRHKIADAGRSTQVPSGYLLHEDRRRQVNGAPGQRNEAPTAEVPAAGFPTVRIAEVKDDGPVKWLVKDLWMEQGVGIIGGEPKSYKSFVSAQVAVCVAAGKPIFGKYETTKGGVLMFNAEDRPQMTRQRIDKMCCALDLKLSDLDVSLINVPQLRLDDQTQIKALSSTVAHIKPSLLILDPLRDLHGLDENDAQIVAALLSPLRVIQREHGCAVMLVHHMAKVSETKRRAGQRLRGSSVLHGWVDSALYLEHKDGAIQVEIEHRAAPAPENFRFTLENAETPTGSALWLELHTTEEEDTEQREKEEAADNCVIAAVSTSKSPMTLRDIRKACKQRGAVTDAAVRRLCDSEMLVDDVTIERGNQTLPAFRINPKRSGRRVPGHA
jgi:hypothetical protein